MKMFLIYFKTDGVRDIATDPAFAGETVTLGLNFYFVEEMFVPTYQWAYSLNIKIIPKK